MTKIFDVHGNEIDFNAQTVLTVRKRPVVVHAFRANVRLMIYTKEGMVIGEPGDYIIKGIQGECYPCDKETCEQTYDFIEEQ